MSVRCLAILLLATASTATARQARAMRGAAAPLPAAASGAEMPAAASGAAPSKPGAGSGAEMPSIDVTTVETEVKNMNYYDLTKEENSYDLEEELKDDAPPIEYDGPTDATQSSSPNYGMTSPNDDEPPLKDDSPKGSDPLGEMFEGTPSSPETGSKESGSAVDDSASGGSVEGQGPIDDPPGAGSPEAQGPSDDSPAAGGVPEAQGLDGLLKLGSIPWPKKANLVQVGHRSRQKSSVAVLGAITVQSALRSAIENAVKDSLPCTGSASSTAGPAPAPAPAPPAPAPAVAPGGVLPATMALASTASSQPPLGNGPPPAAQIRTTPRQLRASPRYPSGPAPGPAYAAAPGAADTCGKPKVHVALLPGSKMQKRHLLNSPLIHATVLVKVTLFDRPGNGLNDMQGVKSHLKRSLASGELKGKIAAAIHGVTGVKPELADIKVKTSVVKLWDLPKCGRHMKLLVKSFTRHYTKRQVPMALYNECTNFMTKMSFSHDYVLDARDATRCRKATAVFAKRWKLGDSNDPKDFEPLCERFCEAKFGEDAPQCHFDAR